jgi:hypothetical protein
LLTDAVLPGLAGLVHEWHAEDITNICVEDVVADGTAVVTELGVENYSRTSALLVQFEGIASLTLIAESSGMAQQHPQGDLVLLLHQAAIILENLDLLQFWAELVDLLVVIKAQDTLLDGLHASHGGEQFGAGGDPEDAVERHGLIGIEATLRADSVQTPLLLQI